MKNGKRLACDTHAFATHTGLVDDDTNADRWMQSGSTHSHAFAAFKCQFWTNWTRNQVKNSLIFFPFLWIGSVLLCVPLPFNEVGWWEEVFWNTMSVFLCVHVSGFCLVDIFRPTQPFGTKLGMVVHHLEPECQTEKNSIITYKSRPLLSFI